MVPPSYGGKLEDYDLHIKCRKVSKFYLVHVGADELHGLLQRVCVAAAGVDDEGAQRDVRQEIWVIVDLVYRVKHRLEPLHAFFLFDSPARGVTLTAYLLVHGKNSAEDDVASDPQQLAVSLRLRTERKARQRLQKQQERQRPRQQPHRKNQHLPAHELI